MVKKETNYLVLIEIIPGSGLMWTEYETKSRQEAYEKAKKLFERHHKQSDVVILETMLIRDEVKRFKNERHLNTPVIKEEG